MPIYRNVRNPKLLVTVADGGDDEGRMEASDSWLRVHPEPEPAEPVDVDIEAILAADEVDGNDDE